VVEAEQADMQRSARRGSLGWEGGLCGLQRRLSQAVLRRCRMVLEEVVVQRVGSICSNWWIEGGEADVLCLYLRKCEKDVDDDGL